VFTFTNEEQAAVGFIEFVSFVLEDKLIERGEVHQSRLTLSLI
jgi:hypothetical protein